jgi:hypothetical protein
LVCSELYLGPLQMPSPPLSPLSITSSLTPSLCVVLNINLQGNPLFTPYTPIVNLNVAPSLNMAANPPRINSVVNIPHFQGRPRAYVRKFEIACVANSVPPIK